jgi:hypothetical protein
MDVNIALRLLLPVTILFRPCAHLAQMFIRVVALGYRRLFFILSAVFLPWGAIAQNLVSFSQP